MTWLNAFKTVKDIMANTVALA